MDMSFTVDQSKHKGPYASYHTGYETYFMISNNTDPGFKIMQGCGRLALLFLKYISDSTILPLALTEFPKKMNEALASFETNGQAATFRKIYDKYEVLPKMVNELQEATKEFHEQIKEDLKNPLEIRRMNDQLMKFEQVFIMPNGLPNRPSARHAIFASGLFDTYGSSAFPGLTDALHEYEDLTGEEKIKRDKVIKRHISDLTILMHRAKLFLKDPTSI